MTSFKEKSYNITKLMDVRNHKLNETEINIRLVIDDEIIVNNIVHKTIFTCISEWGAMFQVIFYYFAFYYYQKNKH